MSDKLDFTGFEGGRKPPAPPRGATVRRRTITKAQGSNGRRKRRVNVSLEPRLSEQAVVQAEYRGMTLSDLVREAYRNHRGRVDRARFAEPEPFSPSHPIATGRVVHMLYLTSEEVAILDDLAAEMGSTRSGVVAALLTG